MENYIVRIYRRDEVDPNNVVGVCESVERETRDSFNSLGRLMSLISPARAVPVEAGELGTDAPEARSEKISIAD